MSIKALNYALDIKVGDPTAKLIFINLANHYNDATEYSYPSQELLAERAECSIRTVQRKLEMLSDLGLIKKKFRPNKSSLYEFPGVNGYDTADVSDCHIQKMVTTNKRLVTTDGVVRTINNNHYNILKGKKSKKEILLVDFEVTDELKKYAINLEIDADEVIEDIRLWNEQNGNKAKYANPNAFYMNWFRKEAKRKPKTVLKVQSDQKDKTTSVRAEKTLSQPQKDLIENWLEQIHRKSKTDNRFVGENYDKLREAFTNSMKFQYADFQGGRYTTRQLQEMYELGRY